LVSVQLTTKPTDKPVTTRPIFFECKKEESFSGAIQKAMKNVDIDAQVAIDPRLVASIPIRFMADNMEAFALFLKRQSKRIILDSNYIGITTVRRVGGYNFTDNSTDGIPISVLFNDLIGQPVWLDVLQVQMKLVMRADIIVGSTIEMPKDYIAVNRARILGTVKDKIEFTGNAFVSKVRHVGTSRQPDANSWVTIIDAILTTK